MLWNGPRGFPKPLPKMLVVLDGLSLAEVIAADSSVLRDTIIRICDRIVITDHILVEYSRDHAVSNLQLELDKFFAEHPTKLRKANPRPVGASDIPRHHRRLVRDAIGTQADYLITHGQRLLSSADAFHRRHNLSIVTPGQYMAERMRTRP